MYNFITVIMFNFLQAQKMIQSTKKQSVKPAHIITHHPLVEAQRGARSVGKRWDYS